MKYCVLPLGLLMTVAFSLATTLEPWHQNWAGSRTGSDDLLAVAIGDSRQLFARHFFLKADAYFHNGYYPTIFDNKEGFEGAHIAEDVHAGKEDKEEEKLNYLGESRDWIDTFSRNFFPSQHTHLGDAYPEPGRVATNDDHHHHDHDAHGEGHDGDDKAKEKRSADEREILPWLKLSLELDPKRVETYVVAAFWLRNTLHQTDEAERVLRQGLSQVPGNPEILFELGRIHFEERNDLSRARNVWERALYNWDVQERGKAKPNVFILAQIIGNLATLEEKAGRLNEAVRYLEALAVVSPNKAGIAKWLESVREKARTGNANAGK